MILWFTGLSGSGKSTIAKELKKTLVHYSVEILDGDILRKGINSDLGFSKEDREENVRRTAEIAKILSNLEFNVIVAFISPYAESREKAKKIIGEDNFKEIYIAASLDDCIRRDPKGLYKKALSGEIKEFTGISDPYEEPVNPFLKIETGEDGPENLKLSVDRIYKEIKPLLK